MPTKKFLMLSLQDEQAKEISKVLGNPSSKKILEYLSERDATESHLSNALSMPISTVHHSLKQLKQSNLVITEEFHYSKKGKEVLHYKLANKYIIIAPKSTYGLKQKLMQALPILAGLAVIGGAVQWIINTSMPFAQKAAATTFESVATTGALAPEAEVATDMIMAAPPPMEVISTASKIPWIDYVWLFIIIAGTLSIATYLAIEYLRKK